MKINLDFPEVFFVGNNGQGKTNILESIYFLCYGSSFRTKSDSIIIQHGKKEMAASATFQKTDSSLNKIVIQYVDNSKKIIFNEKFVTDRREIMLNMPCIVFCHGDLDFVTGSPDKKRLFFDQTLSLLDYEYTEYLRNYKTILKSRNKLLKNGESKDIISVYTNKLIELGIYLQIKREKIITEFNSVISIIFNNISDLKGELKIEYINSWKYTNKNELSNYLENKFNYELKMKTSCYGPHRDNFKFIYDGKDFNEFASTGQLRLLSLILRSAQGKFYYGKTNRKPILLLDDVLLELDQDKRDKFMKNLPPYDQVFYTFLPDSSALSRDDVKVYNVKNGDIL